MKKRLPSVLCAMLGAFLFGFTSCSAEEAPAEPEAPAEAPAETGK